LYQPMFDLNDMAVVGVEALLRWIIRAEGCSSPTSSSPLLMRRA
jgi:sensor c-di-GMP phosphodiesterase-like protein